MQARVRFAGRPRNPLRRSCVSSARNAGESAICPVRAQPSAEIVRVECAKCRRECDSPGARATLCGDRACRVREMQARVRFAGCPRNPLRRSRAKCRRECDLSGPRATLCGDRACRVREMQARVRFAGCPRNPLRRSCVLSARNAGESAICRLLAQPSAEIVRVECAKCRQECDLLATRATLCGDRACRVREMQARVRFAGCRATLCGDRACRVREMQARVRFAGCPHNPLRRSCVSRARSADESAICPVRAQPSAEIVRVECAKRRRECDLVRKSSTQSSWGAGS